MTREAFLQRWAGSMALWLCQRTTRRKVTALRQVGQIRGLAVDAGQGLTAVLQRGQTVEQRDGVRVTRAGENLQGGAAFDNPPGVHHGDAVAHLGHDAEVMGDEDQRHIGLPLQVFEQAEILGLDGHIERGRGLVGQQQAWLTGDGDGPGHPLAHATAHLMRKGRHTLLWRTNAYLLQQLDDAPLQAAAAQTAMQAQRLGNLHAHGKGRVERSHGILQNHGDLCPAQLAHLLGTLVQQIFAVKENFSADNAAARLRHQAHNGQAGHRLARAGLADNPQGFAPLHGKAGAIDGFHHATPGVYVGA